ncbi:MAG: hypothetical protein Q7R43_03985 [Candidatus Daviesbacteria bacterium]|nr:hypothetical protein [Candidatus Daviesbacteria bacterium]
MAEENRYVEQELSSEWMETIEEGLTDQLDNYELFGQCLNITPDTLTGGEDPRDFLELTPGEQDFIKQKLFNLVGFWPDRNEQAESYDYEIPQSLNPNKPNQRSGHVRVCVFKTGRTDGNMYLHEATLENGQKDYCIAPEDYHF